MVTYQPDQAWLAAPGRKWPVVIDPSITDAASSDCTIYQAQPTTSNPWCGYLGSGFGQFNFVGLDGQGNAFRTLINFGGAIQAIPADSQLIGARLSIDVAGIAGSTLGVLAFPVSQQFTPQLATWNTYDGQNN